MYKWFRTLLGLKPKGYIRQSDIIHYGGQTPEWAQKHDDNPYVEGSAVLPEHMHITTFRRKQRWFK